MGPRHTKCGTLNGIAPRVPMLRNGPSLASRAQAAAKATEKARHQGDAADDDDEPLPPLQVSPHVVPLPLAAMQVMLPRFARLVRARPQPLLDVRGASVVAAHVRGTVAARHTQELCGSLALRHSVPATFGQERAGRVVRRAGGREGRGEDEERRA
eukprot:CAMPEP_0198541510 /NCGR_PEP_ID=MMETSP1462-20131121/54067_1 /TAXON_ID=1333877 /ORGANISM="Brandtodinium nutriculum, Strain RCC3387" /LENGTH=155 /DNA_ID=CAMNT_0044271677 /DNA_START=38 /DNA_END=501 /DNA_ORIENTATION=+